MRLVMYQSTSMCPLLGALARVQQGHLLGDNMRGLFHTQSYFFRIVDHERQYRSILSEVSAHLVMSEVVHMYFTQTAAVMDLSLTSLNAGVVYGLWTSLQRNQKLAYKTSIQNLCFNVLDKHNLQTNAQTTYLSGIQTCI